MGFFDFFRRAPRRTPIAALPAPAELRSLRPQDVLPSNWSPMPDWSLEGEDDLAKLDAASTWVFACVHKLAQFSSSFPWFVQKRRGDTWERDDNSPLQPLLDKPNEAMSLQAFIETVSMHLSLNGNAVVTKVRAGKKVVELWPIGPLGIKPIAGKRGQPFIIGYEYKVGSSKSTLAASDVIHILQRDPSNAYWGAGPLQLCSRAVDVEKSAAEWQKVTFQNLAVPPGVFTFDQHITRDQQRSAKELYLEQAAGSDNARIPLFVGGGAKWVQTALSPAELDFLQSRGYSAKEVCALFRTPPPIVGIYDDATYNNISTAERMYLEHTVLPWIFGIRDALNGRLAVEFGGYRFYIDVSKIPALLSRMLERSKLAESLDKVGAPWNIIDSVLDLGLGPIPGGAIALAQLERRVKLAKDLWGMGVPFNRLDKALELGVGDIEGGDKGYLPANVQPSDMLGDVL